MSCAVAFQRVSSIREGGFGCVLRGDALALVDVEHIVVAEEGNLLLLAGLFVLLLHLFPEDHHVGLLARPDPAASLLARVEGQVFAGAAQYERFRRL